MKNSYICKFIALISSFLISCSCTANPPTPPIIKQIDLSKAGEKLHLIVRIKESHDYDFQLRFMFSEGDAADRARIKEIVEGNSEKLRRKDNYGIEIPLTIKVAKIHEAGELLIQESDLSHYETTSFGSDHFTKTIIRLDLEPGTYRVIITNKTDIPLLETTLINFSIVRAYLGK
jgi:hypothetical protein